MKKITAVLLLLSMLFSLLVNVYAVDECCFYDNVNYWADDLCAKNPKITRELCLKMWEINEHELIHAAVRVNEYAFIEQEKLSHRIFEEWGEDENIKFYTPLLRSSAEGKTVITALDGDTLILTCEEEAGRFWISASEYRRLVWRIRFRMYVESFGDFIENHIDSKLENRPLNTRLSGAEFMHVTRSEILYLTTLDEILYIRFVHDNIQCRLYCTFKPCDGYCYERLMHSYAITDTLLILKHLSRLEPLTPEQVALYDFYGTGNITIHNALEILKYLARLDSLID
jgi:hypothetical protein